MFLGNINLVHFNYIYLLLKCNNYDLCKNIGMSGSIDNVEKIETHIIAFICKH